jgi:hypothetical protein
MLTPRAGEVVREAPLRPRWKSPEKMPPECRGEALGEAAVLGGDPGGSCRRGNAGIGGAGGAPPLPGAAGAAWGGSAERGGGAGGAAAGGVARAAAGGGGDAVRPRGGETNEAAWRVSDSRRASLREEKEAENAARRGSRGVTDAGFASG